MSRSNTDNGHDHVKLLLQPCLSKMQSLGEPSADGPKSQKRKTKLFHMVPCSLAPTVAFFTRYTPWRSGEEPPDWSLRQNAAPTPARLLLHRQSDADESSQGCRSEQWSLWCQSWLCVRQIAKPSPAHRCQP